MTKEERFTEYYTNLSTVVYRYSLARAGDPELAKDATQHAFSEFFRFMDKVPDDIVKAWLFLCSKNKIIDECRKEATRQKVMSKTYRRETHIVSEDNTEALTDRMMQEQLSTRILCDLREKNESWYRIVVAVSVMEMSHDEAAEYLGISKQVLCAKLYRARQYLWKPFGKDYTEI